MALSTDTLIVMCRQGDSPLLFRAVMVNDGGSQRLAVAADFSGITFRVFDVQSGEVSGGPPEALVPAAVVADPAPSSGLLSGMNFSFQLDGGVYLDRGDRVRAVEVEFELTGGATFTRAWEVWAERVRGR